MSAVIGLVAGCGVAVARGPVEPSGDAAPAVPRIPEVRREEGSGHAPLPANLGTYGLPGLPGAGTLSRVRAIRRRVLQSGDMRISQDVLQLVRRIVSRLSEHSGPYMLLVSSLRDPLEGRLAGAMLGIGLQQLGQRVLVVEFGFLPRPGAGIYVNGASGLPTILVQLDAGRGRASGAPFSLADIPVDTDAFDFILLMGPSVSDAGWDATHFERADLMLIALAATDDAAETVALLRRRLDGAQMARSATLVVALEDAQGAAL